MPKLTNKQILSVLGIICIIILVVGYYIYTIINEDNYEEIEYEEENIIQNTIEGEKQEKEIIVHIAGEVNKEGIVKIKEGARIADVIDEAGGLTEKSNIKNVNLAYIVKDGQKITIPSIEEQNLQDNTITEYITKENGENVIQDNDNQEENNIKININKATKEELTKLPGIGDSTADKIIEYRNTNGEFSSIEDIKNVSGIGESKFNNIIDYIEVK